MEIVCERLLSVFKTQNWYDSIGPGPTHQNLMRLIFGFGNTELFSIY